MRDGLKLADRRGADGTVNSQSLNPAARSFERSNRRFSLVGSAKKALVASMAASIGGGRCAPKRQSLLRRWKTGERAKRVARVSVESGRAMSGRTSVEFKVESIPTALGDAGLPQARREVLVLPEQPGRVEKRNRMVMHSLTRSRARERDANQAPSAFSKNSREGNVSQTTTPCVICYSTATLDACEQE